jgi:hypothetical protein
MIDMGVGKNHGIKFGRGKGERVPVALPQPLETLKHTAIDQYLALADREKILGAGHRTDRSVEGQLNQRVPVSQSSSVS